MGRDPKPNIRALLGIAGALALAMSSRAQTDSTAATPEPSKPATKQPKPLANPDDEPRLTVRMKDGRTMTGRVIRQNAEEVVLEIEGIQTRIATETIDRWDVEPSFNERYRELRQAVGDEPDQIIKLAEWLRARARYTLALSEVERALRIDPAHEQGKKLRLELSEQVRLQEIARRQKEDQDDDAEKSDPAPRQASGPIRNFPLLTQSQVDLMKVYEIDLKDAPRVLISRETITRMLDRYADHPLIPVTKEGRESIYRKPPAELLDLMFRLQARELYPEVQVLDQPKAMVTFRDQLQRTWLLNSCATNQCHGGAEAGRLALFNRRPNADRSVYTNFYILTHFRLSDGTPLIDFERPERSPLLQMTLPRERSRNPHPLVRHPKTGRDVFRPVFRSDTDRGFEDAVAWIKSLYRPRPTYPFEYTPARPFRIEAPVPVSPPQGKPTPEPGPSAPAPSPERPDPKSEPTPPPPAPPAPR